MIVFLPSQMAVTSYILKKYRQVADGIPLELNYLSHLIFDMQKKRSGKTFDKTEIIQIDVWKTAHHYRIYIVCGYKWNNKHDFLF